MTVDALEQMEADEERVISPAELFRKWEQGQWRLTELPIASDAADWAAMRPYARGELESMIEGFVLGEAAVSNTLSPLADAAPSLDAHQYLCTQIADEARHTRFFATYLQEMRRSRPSHEEVIADALASAGDAVSTIFDEELKARTDHVRFHPEDTRAWYEAVTYYHLMAEGVLAMSVLGAMLSMVRQLRGSLPVLHTGLRNVIRDESRHMAFGMYAAREGVHTGHGDAVLATMMEAIPQVTMALVAPERKLPGTTLPPLRATIGKQHAHRYAGARRTLLRRMELIGLQAHTGEAGQAWDLSMKAAMTEYEHRHGDPHPAGE
ncbi:ribonucleotide-diphosphate reductase subunit beta [Streptomyces sp. NBC_00557]|uniref:ribonucleotide-diphosphate reductase subunit beta n=1 Tax=Streptomyces sp. NBC_00557 TaxID=2975776 RepID=UPI002E80E28B|nr:ribonucleotide-diphosphate reductase subunit beta [Streptomyces sp. NBC_00557]WUC40330.1 ribonucleotide-diphosphate reductase subunit beta [Streptomyces sp. NBC_00557]